MMKGILRIAAWLLFFAISLMTIGPVTLRPRTSFPVDLERLIAWVCLGALFAVAYPTGRISLALLLVGAAAGLELAQQHVLGRHGELSHFAFKAGGALVGVMIASLVDRLQSKRRAKDPN